LLKLRLVLLPLMLGAALIVLPSIRAVAATTGPAAGSITQLSGNVEIERGGHAIPATSGAPVEIGDSVVTGPSSKATITLTDQSQLELSEHSTLVLDENTLDSAGVRQSTKVRLLGGLVRAIVHFTAGTPPNFEVHTPNAVASARGTTFDVSYQTGVTR
jgi:hypothetical protein